MLTKQDKKRAAEYALAGEAAVDKTVAEIRSTIKRRSYEDACREKNDEALVILEFALFVSAGFELDIDAEEYLLNYDTKEARLELIKKLGVEEQYIEAKIEKD